MSKFTLFGFFVLLFVIQISAQRSIRSASNDVEKPQKEGGLDSQQSPVQRKSSSKNNRNKITAKQARQLRTDSKLEGSPCVCENTKCDCCADVDLPALRFRQKGCASFTYDPENLGVEYTFGLNNRQITRNEISAPGNSIAPQCSPLPRWPAITICARYNRTQVSNNGVRFCLSMEARFQGFTFYRMDFDCVNQPANGASSPAPARARSSKKSKKD